MSEKTKNILLIIAGILILLLIAAGIFMYRQYQNAQSEVVVWNDSTYYYKNKYQEEYLAKNTYIMKAEELKEYNDSLYKEYQALKDQPILITKTKFITYIDTIKTKVDSLWNDSCRTGWQWSATDSCWYAIEGTSMMRIDTVNNKFTVYTDINRLYVENGITLDLIDDGNQLAVIARSNNPYTNISDMQSVVIDPTTSPTIKKYFKPKRWGFGPYLGIGVYTGYGWSPNTGNGGSF